MSTAAGLMLGFLADRALGDPRSFHPVAGFGRVAGRLEDALYADDRARGVAYTLLLGGGAVSVGLLAERVSRRSPTLHTGLTALVTWAVLGGRSLEAEAHAVEAHLAGGDLPAARLRLTHLVGRETADLDEPEIARAVVESVAENTSDAVVAPLFWGAVAGIPGLLGYRVVNTLDAMVGHRDARYERFGWASARLDDVVNLPAARLAGLLTMLVNPRTAQAAWRDWHQDAAHHPSPNAGVVEASFAATLGVRLGGLNTYRGRAEHRAELGAGRPVVIADIRRATSLGSQVERLAAATTAAGAALAAQAHRRRCPDAARGSEWSR